MKYKNAAGQVQIVLDSGAPFDDSATYTVITTDFLYYGGAKYDFASYDPTPTDLGAHMRDPVISWTTAPNTSAADPVESHIDATLRDQF
jgi:2',3'-cyclic-nucleotide 2'-phosphodiesterase (5'-nucleotidase family)